MRNAVAIVLLLGVCVCASAAEPMTLKKLVGGEVRKDDMTVTISVDMKQKSGDRESKVSEKVQAFIAADRPNRALLRVSKQTLLSEAGLSVMWTDDLQAHRVAPFSDDAARWSDFSKMNMHVFWVIPAPGQVGYFDDNFAILSVQKQAGKAVAKFGLRERPADEYWRKLKEKRDLKITGALTVRTDKGVVSDATVEMHATGHSRFFAITASHKFGPVPAETFAIPPKIAEKVAEKKEQEQQKQSPEK